MSGTFDTPAFQIGITLAEEHDGQVLATNDPWIKLGVGFRPYLAQLSGNEVKALLAIGLRINEGYEAWPSLRTIGEECGYSHTTANRCVKALEDLGLIEVVRKLKPDGSSEANRYKIKAHFAVGRSKPAGGGTPANHRRVERLRVTPVERLSVTEVDSLEEDSSDIDKNQNHKLLTGGGVWSNVAKQFAGQFRTIEIEAALDQADPAKFDGKRGGVIKSILDRWLEYPEDRAREVARFSRDPYRPEDDDFYPLPSDD